MLISFFQYCITALNIHRANKCLYITNVPWVTSQNLVHDLGTLLGYLNLGFAKKYLVLHFTQRRCSLYMPRIPYPYLFSHKFCDTLMYRILHYLSKLKLPMVYLTSGCIMFFFFQFSILSLLVTDVTSQRGGAFPSGAPSLTFLMENSFASFKVFYFSLGL